MSKKTRVVLISVSGILAIFILTAFIGLMSIRSEFSKYLDTQYPKLSFKMKFTKIDIIYGSYYANVTCLNDGTVFSISKNFSTKGIDESYAQNKSTNQYNSKVNNVFEGNEIKNNIVSITGGGKLPFTQDGTYEQINIQLINEVDHIPVVVKKILFTLKEKNISAEKVIFTYEKEKGLYEWCLSSNDYVLTEKEIEFKIKRIK